MPDTPRTLARAVARGRRATDKLLTLDRALLAGAFAAGVWIATADLRHGNLSTRVAALEQTTEAHQRELNEHDRALLALTIKFENVEKALTALAESTAQAVNRLQDRPARPARAAPPPP